MIGEMDARPTDGEVERSADLQKQLDAVVAGLRSILDTDLLAFNDAARAAGFVPVDVPKASSPSK